MTRLSPSQVQSLKDRNPISEVIGPFVTWDKKKSNPSKQEFWACCPFHSERSPSFKCDDRRQTFKCFGCGESGDAIEFLMKTKGYNFKESVEALGGEIEVSEEEKRAYAQRKLQAEEKDRKSKQFREELALDLWQHAIVAGDTLADVYFKSRVRAWDGFHTDQIRFHPEAYYSKNLKLPCVVCLVTGPDGNPCGVWRIYLNKDGTNFRDETGKKVKKGLGPCMESGGAIRLFPVTDGTIGACEGVESGYGAWNLCMREVPVWPMMATSGMVNFQKPFGVSRVIGFPDGDVDFDKNKQTWREPPGRKAWRSLEERLRSDGVATGTYPTEFDGSDPLENWNECFDRFGVVAA